MPAEIPAEFLARLKSITAKRAKTVIDHIIKHGAITTEELKDKYGYNHPPRAAQDVRDLGIPIQTFKTVGSDGRSIAAYRFDLSTAIDGSKDGRRSFPKIVKTALLERNGPFCAVCRLEYHPRYLQIDHRVPYEVAGETLSDDIEELMLVCGSCNRLKSFSCENCENWRDANNVKACQTCYWANPNEYEHMALVQIRRLDVAWKDGETKVYDKLRTISKKQGVSVQDLVKKIVRDSSTLK